MVDSKYVAQEIERLLEDSTSESAFHNLIELDPSALPVIIERIRLESADAIRIRLIEVVREFRDAIAVPVLVEMVASHSAGVFQAALDGLVTIGGDAATDGLRAVIRQLPSEHPRRAWIEEALFQIQAPSGDYSPGS